MFTGGNAVSSLRLDDTSIDANAEYLGLFQKNSGTIRGLRLLSPQVDVSSPTLRGVGAVCGYSRGSLESDSVDGADARVRAALTAADQAMASVMSTVLSKLNAFLDSELEQVICRDNPIDAERFASSKCAIFVVIPEEDPTKNFIASLMIQNLSRELFSVADENRGRLKNRVVIYADEFGTMPPFDVLPLFSAGRSRGLSLVPIIQSLAQLEKNYGKEGAEIVCDNCQDTIFGGFAPQSKTAEALSSALGSRTVLSGSVSQGKESSQSLQMMERALMTPDELKSIPKGEFVVMKTGTHPMRTKLRLFLDWGITFDPDGYRMPEQAARKIAYVDQSELVRSIHRSCTKNPYNMEGSR